VIFAKLSSDAFELPEEKLFGDFDCPDPGFPLRDISEISSARRRIKERGSISSSNFITLKKKKKRQKERDSILYCLIFFPEFNIALLFAKLFF